LYERTFVTLAMLFFLSCQGRFFGEGAVFPLFSLLYNTNYLSRFMPDASTFVPTMARYTYALDEIDLSSFFFLVGRYINFQTPSALPS